MAARPAGRRCTRSYPTSRRVHTENSSQVVAHWLLELVVATGPRIAIGSPPLEMCRVPESPALHRVVLHLQDTLGTQRGERQVLARAPPALRARHPVGVGDRPVGPLA